MLLLTLAGCSDDVPLPTYVAPAPDSGVAARVQEALDRRAEALRTEDLPAFRAQLDEADPGLVDEQEAYFDNLTQLPLGELRYEVDPGTITAIDGTADHWVEVVLVLGLEGYDATPTRTRDRLLFTPSPEGDRLVVTSTTDYAWEADHPGSLQPWDLGPVRVEESRGVLGVFDEDTVAEADLVLDAAGQGVAEVGEVIGSGASSDPGVVVYAVEDADFLRDLSGQAVGDPDRADGLTIAVPVEVAQPALGVASFRVYLNPRVLDQDPAVLGRLVRHELTHALLGARGRSAPVWLSEGIAEYVSVRSMDPGRRQLPAGALAAGATADDVPGDAEFAGADAEAWYAVSWWVCEYVASAYGEEVLLGLLDRFDGGSEESEVVEEALGLSTTQLVQRGVALMTTTYGD